MAPPLSEGNDVTGQADWKILTILGLGAVISALVSAVVSYVLTILWQRHTWINDHRKKEWRELIDVLNDCLDKMAIAFEWS
jgi:hypothetical protein